jgi:hypothetical protein
MNHSQRDGKGGRDKVVDWYDSKNRSTSPAWHRAKTEHGEDVEGPQASVELADDKEQRNA